MALDFKCAATESKQGFSIGDALDLCMIGFGQFVARMEQPVHESLLISEQEQAFRIHIQSPDRVNFRRKIEVCQSALTGLICGKLAEDTVGFVKDDKHSG